MTEQEWLAAVAPHLLLPHLEDVATERKLRLIACACCRMIWHLFLREQCQRAVEAAELFADGLIDGQKLEEARHGAQALCHGGGGAAYAAVECTKTDNLMFSARATAGYAARAAAKRRARGVPPGWLAAWGLPEDLYERTPGKAEKAIKASQAALVRCLFWNPFRLTRLDRAWLRWNGGAVVGRARSIYEDRQLDLLPVLSDALEEAGCQEELILEHLRQPGQHPRGCWVIDMILDKDQSEARR